MSSEIHQLLVDQGAHGFVWKNLRKFRNKSFAPPFRVDSPDQCVLGKEYWNAYPENLYTYNFNSWGLRDCDFEQYQKENTDIKVNICIGDSFTLNMGGPAEHSWPHLLSKKLSAPTINIGIDCLTSFHYQAVIAKLKKLLNVDQTFILYNLFDDSDLINAIKKVNHVDSVQEIQQKIKFLKNHCWNPEAHWQFLPPWRFHNSEQLSVLYNEFPDAHAYLKNFKLDWARLDYNQCMASTNLINKYQELVGPSWPDYSKFTELLIIDPALIQKHKALSNPVDSKLIHEYLKDHFSLLLKCNRDGFHMNKIINQQLADYFYAQSIKSRLIY